MVTSLVGAAAGSLLSYLFVRGSGAQGFEVTFYHPTVPALLSGLVIGVFAAHANIVEVVQYE